MTKEIFIKMDGKPIASVRGDVYLKWLRSSTGFLRKPPAIAFSKWEIKEAQDAGATKILVVDMDTGKRYYATFATLRLKGFDFNYGRGDQIGLLLQHWQDADEPIYEQMEMFDE